MHIHIVLHFKMHVLVCINCSPTFEEPLQKQTTVSVPIDTHDHRKANRCLRSTRCSNCITAERFQTLAQLTLEAWGFVVAPKIPISRWALGARPRMIVIGMGMFAFPSNRRARPPHREPSFTPTISIRHQFLCKFSLPVTNLPVNICVSAIK